MSLCCCLSRVTVVVKQHASGSVTLQAQQRAVLCLLHLSAMQRGLPSALEEAVHAAQQMSARWAQPDA